MVIINLEFAGISKQKHLNILKLREMKTIKHTNGKWIANEGQIYPEETGKTLALIPYYNKEDKEQEANAKLIAAAPELLAALIWANKIIDRLADDYAMIANKHANYTKGEYNRIQDAINKAIE